MFAGTTGTTVTSEAPCLTSTHAHGFDGFTLLFVSYAIAVENRHDVVLSWLE